MNSPCADVLLIADQYIDRLRNLLYQPRLLGWDHLKCEAEMLELSGRYYTARQKALYPIPETTAAVQSNPDGPCEDCRAAARLAFSDATTPGFYFSKCERHQ